MWIIHNPRYHYLQNTITNSEKIFGISIVCAVDIVDEFNENGNYKHFSMLLQHSDLKELE